jgi:hypothetical protein
MRSPSVNSVARLLESYALWAIVFTKLAPSEDSHGSSLHVFSGMEAVPIRASFEEGGDL